MVDRRAAGDGCACPACATRRTSQITAAVAPGCATHRGAVSFDPVATTPDAFGYRRFKSSISSRPVSASGGSKRMTTPERFASSSSAGSKTPLDVAWGRRVLEPDPTVFVGAATPRSVNRYSRTPRVITPSTRLRPRCEPDGAGETEIVATGASLGVCGAYQHQREKKSARDEVLHASSLVTRGRNVSQPPGTPGRFLCQGLGRRDDRPVIAAATNDESPRSRSGSAAPAGVLQGGSPMTSIVQVDTFTREPFAATRRPSVS
jgi:hypothetical protein